LNTPCPLALSIRTLSHAINAALLVAVLVALFTHWAMGLLVFFAVFAVLSALWWFRGLLGPVPKR